MNVQQLQSDFFVFSGHKIFGPTGIGVLHAKEELLEIMPPWQGGGNMIRNVTFEETTYADPPAAFEAGTPNIADAVGLGAALDYVSRLGLPAIAKYEQELLQYAIEHLSGINGLRLIGTARERIGVLSFVLRDRQTEQVGQMLDLEGIAVRAGHHSRAAVAAALRARSHRPAVVVSLQHPGRGGPPGRCGEANLAAITRESRQEGRFEAELDRAVDHSLIAGRLLHIQRECESALISCIAGSGSLPSLRSSRTLAKEPSPCTFATHSRSRNRNRGSATS